jgi:hypothetical protein
MGEGRWFQAGPDIAQLPPCLFLKKGGVVCGGDSRNVRASRDFRLRPPSMEKSRRPLRGVTRS